MNQRFRQNAKNDIEKNFYKFMNNANFGFDCRNNANNLKFEPLIHEINELTYIKKYYNLFDSKIENFVNSKILERNINQEFEKVKNIKNKKVKTMIDFENNECNSIKSIIVKGDTNIEVSSRFIKGKMLMFAKLSLKSFLYDMIDVFCFPNEEI